MTRPAEDADAVMIGPYRLTRELGRGGMGAVYEGIHQATGARHAIKTIVGPMTREDHERFVKEARLLARLDHPHVVRIHSADLAHSPPYLVQEMLTGESLADRLRAGPLPLSEVVPLIEALASALDHAHERGVLHRDLKPENVLYDAAGRPQLTDFGLGRSVSAESRRLTAAGDVLGTPAYMAPEQATGGLDQDARTDVYGLGGILYACVTGRPPFWGQQLYEVLEAVIKRAPTPPTSLVPDLPPEVERVCARALAKERDARFASCGQLAAALRSAAVPVEPAGPPLALVAVGVALGALVAVVAGLGWALASGPAPASPAEERALAGGRPEPEPAAVGRDRNLPPPPGWSARWALTDPAPLAATPAEAWPSPTRVQPLAVRAPAALGELFDGVVTCLEEDRLAVDYDLPRALRVTSFLPPALALVLGPGDRVVGRPHGDGLRLLSPNDGSTVLALVGRSRWTRPAVRVGCVVERIDLSSFTIQLRPPGLPVTGLPTGDATTFGAHRRAGTATTTGVTAPFRWPDGLHTMRLAPGASPGTRATVEGAPVDAIDRLLGDAVTDVEVALVLGEVAVDLRSVRVEGFPCRTDRPALAAVPVALGANAWLGVRYGTSAVDGGPTVVLSASDGSAASLELDGRRLLLRRDDRTIARADAPPEAGLGAGRLELARVGWTLVGTLALAERALTISATDPLWEPSTLRAAFGSSGAEVRFEAARCADRAPPTPPAGLEAWGRGLATLRPILTAAGPEAARLGDPRNQPAMMARREAIAREALTALEEAAAGLSAVHQREVRAQALAAAVLAGDAPRAEGLARTLVDAVGVEAARRQAAQVVFAGDAPALLEWLTAGSRAYVNDQRLALAAARGAAPLLPERRAELTFARAFALARTSPGQAADRAQLVERSLRLLEEALAGGYDTPDVHEEMAQRLSEQGRPDVAAGHLERAVAALPGRWYFWSELARAYDASGRPLRALTALIAGVARMPGNVRLQRMLGSLAAGLARRGEAHELVACAVQALADARASAAGPGDPEARRLQAEAGRIAQAVPRGSGPPRRFADYVLFRAGRLPLPPPGIDPRGELLRARRHLAAGERDAARHLLESVPDDRVVQALARLDPELRPLLHE